MNIIIPMAGAGKRFSDAGYKTHKPAIPTLDRRTGNTYPMVVCATMDLPGVAEDGSNVVYIDRDFHKADGVEAAIQEHFPQAQFITVDKLTEGQACTCLLAEELINNEEPLLIAGCDNGMVLDEEKFRQEMESADMLVFTYRHNEAVLKNPNAYGWMLVDGENNVTDISIKKAVSDNPLEDHAVVATFYFRHGADFVRAAERMIAADDRINGEFYVDEVTRHALELGMNVKVFEIDRYLGWGTPQDYEEYMATLRYWRSFVQDKRFLPGA
ncbi:nucleotidyltransferase [Selenomonas ruminantium]|uniref:nucleotidyltransferase n=1 Tax=Selenomonas ruminantium TaxID=971 RepID=UPI00047EB49E|nr:nucleotidyltransferase [Selenomonas ruminantium]